MQRRKQTMVRQKEIVSAARKLIAKYGSEHVTVKKMAEEIGVSEGAIYKHFKSKRDILSFLVDDIESTLMSDIEKHVVNGSDIFTSLENIILEHVSAIEQRKGVTFQIIAEVISLGDKKLNKKIYLVIQKYIEKIQEILNTGAKAGLIRSDINLESAARVYFSITQGLVNIWSLNPNTFNLISEYKPAWQVFYAAIALPRQPDKQEPVLS